MSEEQEKQPATITREELYRQVWSTPMSRLGEQYGISGNGLKKICDRLNVPYPPRGHWAKLSAGKSVTQISLPKPSTGTPLQVTITPTPPPAASPRAPELDPETTQRLQEASAKTTGIAVPAKLRRPHPAIAAWIARHEREVAADRRNPSYWGTTLQTRSFTALERRQQRILSTLFKEAERFDYKVKGEAPHNLSLETGQNAVEFTLRERIKQIRRPLTDEEKAESYSSNQKWRQERIATGELVFTIKTYLGHGLNSEWRDGERPLEEQIDEMVAVLATVGPILEKRRLETEEAQRRRWEEEEGRRREKQEQDQDRNRWRRFIQYAKLWRQTQLAGELISALEACIPHADTRHGGKSAEEWLTWARERRDAFNPSNWDIAALWTEIASITAWDTRSTIDYMD